MKSSLFVIAALAEIGSFRGCHEMSTMTIGTPRRRELGAVPAHVMPSLSPRELRPLGSRSRVL
jgi:hypothetical protein